MSTPRGSNPGSGTLKICVLHVDGGLLPRCSRTRKPGYCSLTPHTVSSIGLGITAYRLYVTSVSSFGSNVVLISRCAAAAVSPRYSAELPTVEMFHGFVILPSPLVSSTCPHQPTAFCSSCVWSYTFVSIQPKVGPISSLE